MRFTQILDFETDRMDEIRALMDEWGAENEPQDHGPSRSMILKDRDNPGRYYVVVEFDSYEEAMRNNDDPRTSEMAQRLESLCSRPTRFLNCDVLEIQTA
ncbi:hypothetical protein BJP40_29015 [Streptomyces sp. CC53]|uniref:hypothetical protein n=1 Tax=unclassified Streptomyces TaxID=2593676 RepID=UPI0008DC7506|nr:MULTISPECIES: hypothetical protein [unclassified Streptomyces]OII59930.1 hypothetical protein BJP39_02195 [Streptomyces sp. CC77]OII62410.1 hypothetical protein BJP40_29015 [Streptomyces sp. CC53]